MSLLSELLTEYSVDIDPTDSPDQAAVKAKQRAVQMGKNPDQAIRAQQTDIADKQREIAAAKESPTKQIDMQIARLQQQIIHLQQQKQRLMKQNTQQ